MKRKLSYLLVGITTFGLASFYYIFHFYTHVIKCSATPHVLLLKSNPVLCVLFNMGLALETAVFVLIIYAIMDYAILNKKEIWEK